MYFIQDNFHVRGDGVEQHVDQGRGTLLQEPEKTHHHHTDGAQMRAG